jgi:HEAT repeat protein
MKKHWQLIILSLLQAFLVQANASDDKLAVNDLYNLGLNIKSAAKTDAFLPSSLPSSAGSSGSINYELSKVELWGFLTSSKDNYPIQLGAFRLKSNAESFFEKVKTLITNDAVIIIENGYYKVRITDYPEVKSNDYYPAYTTDTASLSDTTNTTQSPAKAGGKILFFKGNSPWLARVNYFGRSFAFINALIVTITISIATMLILLIIILLNRTRMEKEERLKNYLLEKYQGLIIDYLFGNASPDDFRLIASDNYRRQVLIDQMIDVSINLKGEEAKKLLGLYKHLGLDRDSINRAYDYRWHKKIKGFRELAFMNIKDANTAIYKTLNSSNEILRMEAQIALVRLSDENPFEFLSHLTRPFSLYEQITLHELMVQHEIKPPSFRKWLSSPNDTVVMFALRMIREFKQEKAEAEINNTLSHTSPSVRWLAVQVAGDMGMSSTLETMKRMYKNQDYNICLEIVRSMGKMPDISMMGFLKLVLDKEEDVQLQIEATKAIENMGEEGVKTLVKLMKSEYKNYNIIVRHVLDRRIY